MAIKNEKNMGVKIISIIAILMSCYQLYISIFGVPEVQLHRSLHLMLALILCLGTYNFLGKANKGKIGIFDWILIGATILCLGYFIVNFKSFQDRIQFVTPLTKMEIAMFSLLILLVLEGTRRLVGNMLPIICVVFIMYAFWGNHIPGFLSHTGHSFEKILEQIVITSEGIFGSSLGVTATYVATIIIFSAFLNCTGASQFFIDLSTGIAGAKRGGPAKVAIVGSGLFGMISGSAVANVVSVGSFTIPMIKKAGYDDEYAGSVVAVASTGGQFMPPVMAAVAFILADFLGVSYLDVCKAALIPAVLYYFCLFRMVDARAVKLGIEGMDPATLPKVGDVLRNGWHLSIPFAVLVITMISGYTPMKAGLYSLISLLLVAFIKNREVINKDAILEALEKGSKSVINVSLTSACAGIIVGVIILTSLGLKFTSLIIALSNENMFIALVLSAIVAIILGMGLPTIPAYIVMSSLIAPALITMGALPIAAHLFVLYFAVISCITPPVAIASYAAAAISGADAIKVGWQSVRLGVVAYVVPFLFVYNPVLIAHGNTINIIWSFLTAGVGMIALTYSIEGVINERISLLWRMLMFLSAALMIYPEGYTDIVGIIIFAATYIFHQRIVAQKENVITGTK